MINSSSPTARHNIKISDDQLENYIDLSCQGDMEAFAQLYEETKSSVYGFALAILKDPTTAEDVLQDTYLHIYGSCRSYHAMGKPMAWILTITRNLALMKIRENNHRVNLPEDVDIEDYFDQSPQMAPEERLLLQATLKELSDQELQVIMLHAVSGFKHREIAKLLHLPLSTVLSSYSRGCKKVKRMLTEEETHEEGTRGTTKNSR